MNRRQSPAHARQILAAGIACLLLLAASTTMASAAQVKITLSGAVYSSLNKPIAAAQVQFGSATATTNAHGDYRIVVDAASHLSGSAWAPGFAEQVFGLSLSFVPENSVTVQIGTLHLQDLFDNPTFHAKLRGLHAVMNGAERTVNAHGRTGVALDPHVYVTQPDGRVQMYSLTIRGSTFKSRIPFRTKGVYQVEILSSQELQVFNVPVYDGVTPAILNGPSFPADPRNHGERVLAKFALKLVNKVRTAAREPKIHGNSRVDRAALGHSQDAARYGYFYSHPHIGSNGSNPAQRMAKAGMTCSSWGEDVGLGASISAVMDGFDLSPSHRRVLLGAYQMAGAGVVVWRGQYLVTLDFCSTAKSGKRK
ncbi:MAG TPA: hypothetical protein VFB34_10725 [Chloroflexota bacterium]|nr:hypothetical protein [Chloroflexota bacterium]